MRYHSTRGKEKDYSAKEAILMGLCPDGGLFVSDALPDVKLDMKKLLSNEAEYNTILYAVFSALLPDFTKEELDSCIRTAYAGKFETDLLTPVTKIGEDRLLELYHGPTAAFKDMALCMLPKLMGCALAEKKERVMIVTATSGDTGKAALSGFQDAPGIGIAVFYPDQKVSDIQYLQMATQEGNNVSVCAVRGNFDDCQSGVKALFGGEAATKLKEEGISLSSANSINVGRLVPQIVYYIDAYRQLVQAGEVNFGEAVDFCVPTGNFGDVLAGYYAKMMGLPVGRLIVASNENNVLTDFLETGIYNRNRPFVKTISPSMDILISSNLERMLYYMSGMDTVLVKGLMQSLAETGCFAVDTALLAKIQETFSCGYADNAASKEAIRTAYETTGRLIDPHTAVAWRVLQDLKMDENSPLSCHRQKNHPTPAVILSTASPYKFAKDVYESLTGNTLPDGADGFAYMDALHQKTDVPVPVSLASLKGKPILHRDVINADEMPAYVIKEAQKDLEESGEVQHA